MTLAIENCLYFASNRLARETERLAIAAYKPTGLSPSYNYILMTLAEIGPLTLHELAAKMGIAPSTMSRFIKKMAADGLITKKNGWRKIDLALSEKGKQLLPLTYACFQQLGKTVTRLSGGLGQKEKTVAQLNQQAALLNRKKEKQ
ncbi:MarR family winged helix-turn-helix transcriptional regulator [Liquorilactobacillus satsumensis]|nr:MarR family transcriptional regulator [Liquorilactobacillus satsumensis]MCP9312212.1 MarR family transcriptional regulator [Liquorilactobacillus satsumensis]MCP9328715.1 MarR family transcriptional regulator [Liquorilactobacillus satsumensis]MCP9357257.1 MarR family transcriptional regulator [Liquorilactobacillus satsumensis]MCP9359491.1 MarR family transcriptional regulator [Liquorilactobacillus satsumensis]MCP9371204.1 MarR family transcriptional regulator [Liquorilactobacillus satsumensi